MDPIWLPAALVLALGGVWAVLDGWWTRRRWRLDRDRRRHALAPPAEVLGATIAAGAASPAPAETRMAPAAVGVRPVLGPPAAGEARRADAAHESDLAA